MSERQTATIYVDSLCDQCKRKAREWLPTPPAAAGERLEALAREVVEEVRDGSHYAGDWEFRLTLAEAEDIVLAALRRVGGGQ